jgi:hypothetical protein
MPVAFDSFDAATIRGHLDGERRIGIGCRGNVALAARAGRTGVLTHTIRGRYKVATLNAAQPASPSLPASRPSSSRPA